MNVGMADKTIAYLNVCSGSELDHVTIPSSNPGRYFCPRETTP